MIIAMSTGEVYKNLQTKIVEFFESFLQEFKLSLIMRTDSIENAILDDFDLTFTIEEVPNPARDKLRGEVEDFNNRALVQLRGPIREKLRSSLEQSTDALPHDVKKYLDEIDGVQFELKTVNSKVKGMMAKVIEE